MTTRAKHTIEDNAYRGQAHEPPSWPDGLEAGTEAALAGPDTPKEAKLGLPNGEQTEPRPDELPAELRMTPLAQQNSNLAGPAVGQTMPEGAMASDYNDKASDGPVAADASTSTTKAPSPQK